MHASCTSLCVCAHASPVFWLVLKRTWICRLFLPNQTSKGCCIRIQCTIFCFHHERARTNTCKIIYKCIQWYWIWRMKKASNRIHSITIHILCDYVQQSTISHALHHHDEKGFIFASQNSFSLLFFAWVMRIFFRLLFCIVILMHFVYWKKNDSFDIAVTPESNGYANHAIGSDHYWLNIINICFFFCLHRR